jgi:hypothetical protein
MGPSALRNSRYETGLDICNSSPVRIASNSAAAKKGLPLLGLMYSLYSPGNLYHKVNGFGRALPEISALSSQIFPSELTLIFVTNINPTVYLIYSSTATDTNRGLKISDIFTQF